MEEPREPERRMAHLRLGLAHADRHVGLRGHLPEPMAPFKRKRVEPKGGRRAPTFARSRQQSLRHCVAGSACSDTQMRGDVAWRGILGQLV